MAVASPGTDEYTGYWDIQYIDQRWQNTDEWLSGLYERLQYLVDVGVL